MMFTRIRAQIARPWIKRPRGIALLLATFVILTDSSAFAQRGGAGCAGMSGGSSSGSTGAGSFGNGSFGAGGGLGVAGGFNGTQNGLSNPVHMKIAAQQMQGMQNAYGFSDGFNGEYNVDPQTRRAMRAEKAALAKKRLETRKAKQTRTIASRTKPGSDS
jgi:hypothetical protein